MTQQTQTLFFSADHLLRLFSIFGVLWKDNRPAGKKIILLSILTCQKVAIMCWCWDFFVFVLDTCVGSRPSLPSLSMHSSFSRFLMSGLAALISILRLEVGVQGSTEHTSLPFLGVVRGPMAIWFSSDTSHVPNNFFGVFTGIWVATKPSS